MGTPFKMKGPSLYSSPMKNEKTQKEQTKSNTSIDFLKTDYAKGKGVGDSRNIKEANQRINTYGKGKFMATKTKLKAKKKTKHIGNELRKKYGH